ncbi:MAG: radical SAM protein [Candidatus Omnitrophota bacterium]
MKVYIKGLNSCLTRKQKLQQYRDFLVANGHEITHDHKKCDKILLWTCAYRADVRDNSIAQLDYYRRNSKAEVIAAGCLPDIAPGLLEKSFPGRVISWRKDKDKFVQVFGHPKIRFAENCRVFVEPPLCEDAAVFRKKHPGKDVTFLDQFVKLVVSEGCGFKCSYCSERLAFPAYRSFPEAALVRMCRAMIKESGKQEVALIADSLGEYGQDIGVSLPSLVRKLAAVSPGLRIALNNLNPGSFLRYKKELSGFIAKGIIRHINLPIQSASGRMLDLMQRPYTRKDIDEIFTLFNKLKFTDFDTHIIVGFPGETEDDLAETVKFVLRYRPKYVLINKYMEAPEMPSAGLPGKVPARVIAARAKKAARQIKAAGIISNNDGSKRAKDRLERLNHG